MPTYHLTAPNGRTYRMQGPPGLSQDDVIAHVLEQDPDAGNAPPPPKTGLGAAFQSGAENMWSSGKAAVKGLFGDTQEAAAEALAAQQEQGRKYDPQIGLERLGKVYDEKGLLAAGSELVGQAGRGIAQSLPEMGGMAAGARAGAMAGRLLGPAGAVVGGIGGGILGGILPQTGRNLATQQEATPGQVSYGKAAAAGAAQSALEEVAPMLLMGKRVAGKMFGDDIAQLIGKLGPEAAEEVAKRRLSTTIARGAAEGAAGEATTEVMQQALERLQAGQPLLDRDALKAYGEAAYGGAIAGAPLSGAGHAWDRAGAQREVADTEQAAQQAQAQQAAQAQAAAEQQAAQAKAAQRADPAYVVKVGEEYAAYEQKKKDMDAQIKALLAEKTDAGKAAAIELNKEKKALIESAKPLWDEFNATRAARGALAAQEAPAAPEGMLFQPEGETFQGNRISELSRTISDHEASLPEAQQQMLNVMRTGDSSAIAQARAELGQREKTYAAAKKELFKLDPARMQQEQATAEAAQAAEMRAKALATFNPIKARKDIAGLTEKLQSVSDPAEAAQAQTWAKKREQLQSLLDEHEKATAAAPYAEDLFQLDERMQRQGDVLGRRQARTSAAFDADLAAEDAALSKDLTASAAQDTQARRKQDTADALGRVFGTEPRSGMLDVLGATPETGVAQPRETGAMEQVAAEGKRYGEPAAPTAGRVRPGKGPTLPPESRGTVTLEDAQGQGMLFTPEGAPSTTPAEMLRQRIATLLAMPRLAAPAKATLQRAADLLDRPDVPQRILENIQGTVAQAEKGAGRRIDVREGDKVVSDDGRLRLQTRRDVTPASEERAVQGTGVLVGDEGETFPGSPTAKVRTAGRGERPIGVRPLEMEEIGDAGPDADKQPDLFHQMHAGRATPANFQRALDTGALPSKRTGAEARKAHQGMRTAAAILRVKAAGLKARIADAAAAAKRLAGMDQDFATMPDAQREALKATLHDNKMAATKAAQKAKDTAARYKALAESPQFMTAEGSDERAYEHAGRAAQAEQEALKQEERIKDYDDTLNAVISANGAPSAHKMAVRHEALTKELAQVEKDAAEVGKDAKKREQQARKKVQERRGHRATAASAKAGLGGMPTNTVLDEAGAEARTTMEYKAATAAEEKAAAKAKATAERKAAAAKIAAERVQAQAAAEQENKEYLRKRKEVAETGARPYHERTGAEVTQHSTKPRATTVEEVNDAMADITDTALAVPGVTKEALQKVFKRVRNYPLRGVDSRTSVVGNELSRLEDEMKRFRAQNPGGMLPPKHRKSYQQAILEKSHRDSQLKAAESAADRTPLMKRIAELDSHIKWLNDKRTPWLNDVKYQEMRKDAALLQFQIGMIDLHRDALAAGEVLPEASVNVQPEPAKGMVHVEPATKMGDQKPATRMVVAKETKPQKTLYQSKGAPQVEAPAGVKPASAMDMMKLWQEIAAKQATKDEQAVPDWEGEGGRTVPKVVSDAFEASDQTAMTSGMMQRAHDGQLDKVLQAMTTDAQTPLAQELAAKLQAFTKDTNLVVSDRVAQDTVGHYDPATNTITLHPLALTEENLQHEATHAATLRALVAPASSLTKEQLNARTELQALLQRLQADPAFKREYGAENAAELASEVMTNQGLRDKIDAQKPALWTRIKRAVLQMLGMKPQALSAQAMANVEKLFQPSRTLTPAEMAALKEMTGKATAPAAARAATATPALDEFSRGLTAKPRERGLMATVKDANAGLALAYAAVDQRAPLVAALKKGDPAAFMQGHYFIRKADARMAQVGASLTQGTLQLKKDAKGNFVVEASGKTSGKDVFDAIDKLPGATPEAKFALAQSYMVAQRAANKGWDKLGWETSAQTQALGERALKEANANPALKAKLDAVRKVYNDYNQGMIQFLADSGAVSKKLAQDLTKAGDYVPFYRVNESTGVAELALGENTNIRVGDIRKQPYLQELKGDDTKLLPLNEAIMRNTMLLTDMGLKNLATKNIAYSLQDMSNGKNPIRSGKAPAGPDIIKFNQDGEERWMRVTSQGTPFEGIPAEMLVQSLEGSHTVLTGMSKVAGWFGSRLREGVTRTPAYVLRQLIRDPMSAAFTAGTSRGPVGAMLESMREFVSQTRGTSKTGDTLLRKGVTQSGIFNGTAEDMGKIALQLAGGDQSAMHKLFAAADRAAMRADAATRVQVYNDVLKKTGSEMEAELAAIEMMNFTKRGASPTVQYATRMIPFMNAQIQALNVLAKAFRGNATLEDKMQIKAKFIKNAIGLTAFSMLYAAGMEDDEDYKNATAQERMNNFFVPTPMGTIKVPIPYEVGFLFKVLPEMAMRGLSDKLDPTDWDAFRGALIGMVPGGTSMLVPQMISPIVQSVSNRDAFGNKIETDAQQKLAKSERRSDTTSEAAVALSGLMGAVLPESMQLSGPKIEHLVRGYVGSVPIAVAAMADEFLSDKTKPERTASQNPLYGAFIPKNVGTGPVSSGYAALNSIEQVNATLAHLREEEPEKAEAYAQEHAGELSAKGAADAFKQQLKGLKEQQKGIMQDKAMLAADKRKAIDDLARLRNTLARDFTANVRALATSP